MKRHTPILAVTALSAQLAIAGTSHAEEAPARAEAPPTGESHDDGGIFASLGRTVERSATLLASALEVAIRPAGSTAQPPRIVPASTPSGAPPPAAPAAVRTRPSGNGKSACYDVERPVAAARQVGRVG